MRAAALLAFLSVCLLVCGCASTEKKQAGGCPCSVAAKARPAHGARATGGRTLKLACRLANYGPYEAAGFEHIRSLGIKYVFINVPALDQVEAVQQKLKTYDLTPVVMRGAADLSKESSVEELGAQTATCSRMGVKYMFLSAKRNGADKRIVFDRLRRAGDLARTNGVTIVLETHPDLGTNGDVHVETMKQINHPNVRVNFDCANITYYNRDTTAAAELKKVIDHVATVEIKDHNGQFETWDFPALGQGVVDIPGVLRILEENGYDGPITMEIEGVKGVDRSEDEIKKDIAESTAYLRSIGRFE